LSSTLQLAAGARTILGQIVVKATSITPSNGSCTPTLPQITCCSPRPWLYLLQALQLQSHLHFLLGHHHGLWKWATELSTSLSNNPPHPQHDLLLILLKRHVLSVGNCHTPLQAPDANVFGTHPNHNPRVTQAQ
jgi:hypothetical protein